MLYYLEHYIVSILLAASYAACVNSYVSYRPLTALVQVAKDAEFLFLFPFC